MTDTRLRPLAPGGTMPITIPFGEPAYLGWFRRFGSEDVDAVVAANGRCGAPVRYYRVDGRRLSVPTESGAIPWADDEVRAVAAIRLLK